eukprot:9476272-Pyramimonas_sp.AAC.1
MLDGAPEYTRPRAFFTKCIAHACGSSFARGSVFSSFRKEPVAFVRATCVLLTSSVEGAAGLSLRKSSGGPTHLPLPPAPTLPFPHPPHSSFLLLALSASPTPPHPRPPRARARDGGLIA